MDFDATQALGDISFGEELKENRKLVGYLKIQNDGEGDIRNIFEGENIIGRDKNEAVIYIDHKPLSKKHAIINALDGKYTLTDLCSKNKTKLEKGSLKAGKAYDIKDGSNITFADLQCSFTLVVTGSDETESLTGSDADPTSMLNETSLLARETDSEDECWKKVTTPKGNVQSVVACTPGFNNSLIKNTSGIVGESIVGESPLAQQPTSLEVNSLEVPPLTYTDSDDNLSDAFQHTVDTAPLNAPHFDFDKPDSPSTTYEENAPSTYQFDENAPSTYQFDENAPTTYQFDENAPSTYQFDEPPSSTYQFEGFGEENDENEEVAEEEESQVLPFVQKHANSTMINDDFHSFGTPTSMIGNQSGDEKTGKSKKVLSTDSEGESQVFSTGKEVLEGVFKMPKRSSAKQPNRQSTEPQGDKQPPINGDSPSRKPSSLPGGSPVATLPQQTQLSDDEDMQATQAYCSIEDPCSDLPEEEPKDLPNELNDAADDEDSLLATQMYCDDRKQTDSNEEEPLKDEFDRETQAYCPDINNMQTEAHLDDMQTQAYCPDTDNIQTQAYCPNTDIDNIQTQSYCPQEDEVEQTDLQTQLYSEAPRKEAETNADEKVEEKSAMEGNSTEQPPIQFNKPEDKDWSPSKGERTSLTKCVRFAKEDENTEEENDSPPKRKKPTARKKKLTKKKFDIAAQKSEKAETEEIEKSKTEKAEVEPIVRKSGRAKRKSVRLHDVGGIQPKKKSVDFEHADKESDLRENEKENQKNDDKSMKNVENDVNGEVKNSRKRSTRVKTPSKRKSRRSKKEEIVEDKVLNEHLETEENCETGEGIIANEIQEEEEELHAVKNKRGGRRRTHVSQANKKIEKVVEENFQNEPMETENVLAKEDTSEIKEEALPVANNKEDTSEIKEEALPVANNKEDTSEIKEEALPVANNKEDTSEIKEEALPVANNKEDTSEIKEEALPVVNNKEDTSEIKVEALPVANNKRSGRKKGRVSQANKKFEKADNKNENLETNDENSDTKTKRTTKTKRKTASKNEQNSEKRVNVEENHNTLEIDCSPRYKKTTSRRHTLNLAKPKVIFTGITDKTVEKTVSDMGGKVVDNVASATILVTDKVRRTVKFLCALARGIPILSTDWLKKEKNPFQSNYEDHILCDRTSEEQFKFSLKRSLQCASEKPLLEGTKVYVTKNVKPEPKAMKEMIESGGGQFLSKAPTCFCENTLIVSCEEDLDLLSKLQALNYTIHTNELILTGLLRQQIDTNLYKLAVTDTSRQKTAEKTSATQKRKSRVT